MERKVLVALLVAAGTAMSATASIAHSVFFALLVVGASLAAGMGVYLPVEEAETPALDKKNIVW
jgi:hypothetical protein